MTDTPPEPWLRGPMPGISPLIAPVIYSFQQALEDLAKHTAALSGEQVWARPGGLPPVGFQLRHIAGSVDRLTTYLLGRQLDDAQLAALQVEMEPGASREELLAVVREALIVAEARIRSIDPSALAEPRAVGRKRLPTSVIGLLVHIAEHTQRHVGQAISTARLVLHKEPDGVCYS